MISEGTILEAKKGNSEAFKRIYLEFKNTVWNVALKTTRNRTYAEDVTTEVFVKVFTRIRQFKFKSSFKTWLYRITVNTAFNYLKKEKTRETSPLTEEYGLNNDNPEADETFARKDFIDKLLDRLGGKQRMIITLREIEGLSYEEIAGMLKMKPGTVRINVYRAREKLRAAFKEIGGLRNEVSSNK